jgi:KaiC/GvpD/RAD55 family RecA-like ATPase
LEQRILTAVIQSREAFSNVLALDMDHDFSDKAAIIWNLVKEYYGNDETAKCVDPAIIKSQIDRQYPKHAEQLSNFLDDFDSDDVSITNLVKEVYEVKLDHLTDKIASVMAAKQFEEADHLVEQYNRLRDDEVASANAAKVIQGVSAGELMERTKQENLIKVLPMALNRAILGGVLRSHHIVVFAPTDMGKTLFAVNMSYGFLKQGLKVLYVGNEDPGEDILTRLLTRLTGMNVDAIRRNPDKADKIARKRGYDNFILVEADPGTESEIRKFVETYEPDVLIVDQIRNLDMRESNRVLQLERAAQMMRNIGKRYDLLPVSFTQAGDSATGKLFLERGDIDYSNVGIPGTADVLIGIGADGEMEMRGDRMLSLVKNKRGGNKEPIRVKFDHTISKVM